MNNFNTTNALYSFKGSNGVDKSKNEAMFSLYLVIAYLFFEYGRPQLIIPVLRFFHLPAITVILLSLFLLFTGKLYFKDKQTILFMLLLSEMVIHGPIAVNNYWAFQVFYAMCITFIAYLAMINVVDKISKYDLLVKYWIYIFIFLAIFGYFNENLNLPKSLRHGMGVGGFIGDENDFSMALNMILPFALFGIFSAKKTSGKIYYLLLICLFVFVIMVSESRGGFVGLVCVLAYSWIRSNRKMVLIVVMGILVIFAIFTAPTSYWDIVRSIRTENTESNRYGTGAQRIYAWKLGWRMFVENPIIGVGQGNYPWRAGEIENELGVQWQDRSLAGRAAHSLYFTLLPELGLVGTMIYLSIIGFSLKDLSYIKKSVVKGNRYYSDDESRKIYNLALALEGSLIGFLTSSTFISTLYYPNFWMWCGFTLALKKIIKQNMEDAKPLL